MNYLNDIDEAIETAIENQHDVLELTDEDFEDLYCTSFLSAHSNKGYSGQPKPNNLTGE